MKEVRRLASLNTTFGFWKRQCQRQRKFCMPWLFHSLEVIVSFSKCCWTKLTKKQFFKVKSFCVRASKVDATLKFSLHTSLFLLPIVVLFQGRWIWTGFAPLRCFLNSVRAWRRTLTSRSWNTQTGLGTRFNTHESETMPSCFRETEGTCSGAGWSDVTNKLGLSQPLSARCCRMTFVHGIHNCGSWIWRSFSSRTEQVVCHFRHVGRDNTAPENYLLLCPRNIEFDVLNVVCRFCVMREKFLKNAFLEKKKKNRPRVHTKSTAAPQTYLFTRTHSACTQPQRTINCVHTFGKETRSRNDTDCEGHFHYSNPTLNRNLQDGCLCERGARILPRFGQQISGICGAVFSTYIGPEKLPPLIESEPQICEQIHVNRHTSATKRSVLSEQILPRLCWCFGHVTSCELKLYVEPPSPWNFLCFSVTKKICWCKLSINTMEEWRIWRLFVTKLVMVKIFWGCKESSVVQRKFLRKIPFSAFFGFPSCLQGWPRKRETWRRVWSKKDTNCKQTSWCSGP